MMIKEMPGAAVNKSLMDSEHEFYVLKDEILGMPSFGLKPIILVGENSEAVQQLLSECGLADITNPAKAINPNPPVMIPSIQKIPTFASAVFVTGIVQFSSNAPQHLSPDQVYVVYLVKDLTAFISAHTKLKEYLSENNLPRSGFMRPAMYSPGLIDGWYDMLGYAYWRESH